MSVNRRNFLKQSALLTAGAALPNLISRELAGQETRFASDRLPEATWKKLPRWRGFNLLEKFNGRNVPFLEDDFRMIHDLGFNFVRLPMDYRGWIVDGDWRKFDEKTLREIDLAVEYGQKYGIHTMLNFHRAPGYTVAKPQEEKLVWENQEALDVCALHWRTFAKRYAGIPGKNLSFNLFNEPANIEIGPFMKVHRTLCQAIRAEDPNRLIICDGMSWGQKPTHELAELKVAQSTRGYMPMVISHYQASWVGETLRDMKTPPQWPVVSFNGFLFNPQKSGIQENQKTPSVLKLPRNVGKCQFRFKIHQVSSRARLLVEALNADGKPEKVLFDHTYIPRGGEGDWEKVIYKPEWNCWQNIYHKNETVEIPAGTAAIQMHVTEGDWMTIEEFALRTDQTAQEAVCRCVNEWNALPIQAEACLKDGQITFTGGLTQDADWHWKNYVEPWQEWEKTGGVMVGEFGAYNRLPHETVLAWMRDLMNNWKKAGWGWALWNFRGGIGVMDSGRADVQYADYHGLKMDKKMMDLLQEL